MSSRTKLFLGIGIVASVLILGIIVWRLRVLSSENLIKPNVSPSAEISAPTATDSGTSVSVSGTTSSPAVAPRPTQTAVVDTDGDNLTDEQERQLGTDPKKSDTDGDGVSDYAEVKIYFTDPLIANQLDAEGRPIVGISTAPPPSPTGAATSSPPAAAVDSDNDGLTDEQEQQLGTDPNKPDTDGDGLTDFEEVSTYQTNPLKADTDGDGYPDGTEVKSGYNPLGTGRCTRPTCVP